MISLLTSMNLIYACSPENNDMMHSDRDHVDGDRGSIKSLVNKLKNLKALDKYKIKFIPDNQVMQMHHVQISANKYIGNTVQSISTSTPASEIESANTSTDAIEPSTLSFNINASKNSTPKSSLYEASKNALTLLENEQDKTDLSEIAYLLNSKPKIKSLFEKFVFKKDLLFTTLPTTSLTTSTSRSTIMENIQDIQDCSPTDNKCATAGTYATPKSFSLSLKSISSTESYAKTEVKSTLATLTTLAHSVTYDISNPEGTPQMTVSDHSIPSDTFRDFSKEWSLMSSFNSQPKLEKNLTISKGETIDFSEQRSQTESAKYRGQLSGKDRPRHSWHFCPDSKRISPCKCFNSTIQCSVSNSNMLNRRLQYMAKVNRGTDMHFETLELNDCKIKRLSDINFYGLTFTAIRIVNCSQLTCVAFDAFKDISSYVKIFYSMDTGFRYAIVVALSLTEKPMTTQLHHCYSSAHSECNVLSALKSLTNLEEITIKRSFIAELESNAFGRLVRLRKIDMSPGQITKLHSYAFEKLQCELLSEDNVMTWARGKLENKVYKTGTLLKTHY